MKMFVWFFLMISNFAWTQTNTVPSAEKNTIQNEESLYKHVKKNLRIRLFSEFLGHSIYKMDDKQPKTNSNRSADPITTWNQVSFNYNFGKKLNLIVNPRFSVHLGGLQALDENDPTVETNQVFAEDMLVGFQGVVYKNGDFAYFIRPATRLPFSKFSRNTDLVTQPEFFQDFSYNINKKWSIGSWNMIRYYIYESDVDKDRYRLYFAPYFGYNITDKAAINVYYEYEIQHNVSPANRKDFKYTKRNFSDIYAGVTYAFTPTFSLYPFLLIQDRQLWHERAWTNSDSKSHFMKSTKIGLWIMAQLF
jgi:hypothetical protein